MANFVLVHGGAHGAWCWSRLIPHLERKPGADNILAVDLCGHGRRADAKPFLEIGVEDYVESVLEDLERTDLRDVILVGHSLAGLTLPHVAARAADRIAQLVYVSTTNPPLGTSVLELMQESEHFAVSQTTDLNDAFCSDLDDESAEWLLGHLCPQPPGPLEEPSRLVSGPETIPSCYVQLTEDAVLSPAYQLEQAARLGVDRVMTLAAGHSAFASRPAELADLLSGLVSEAGPGDAPA